MDIETDDPVAETERLVGLGAVQLTQWLECRVLRAPGGHLVCVVPVHTTRGTSRNTPGCGPDRPRSSRRAGVRCVT